MIYEVIPPDKPSTHLGPWVVITILLTIFLVLCFTSVRVAMVTRRLLMKGC